MVGALFAVRHGKMGQEPKPSVFVLPLYRCHALRQVALPDIVQVSGMSAIVE